jgi:diguanylate cyclase (GGDEF)-like protein
VLREAGRRFQAAIRPYDSAGRYGGEEFLILLPDLSEEMVISRIETLKADLTAAPIQVAAMKIPITCSMGVALMGKTRFTEPIWSAEYALATADEALYLAKRNGRNRVEYASKGTSASDTSPLHG